MLDHANNQPLAYTNRGAFENDWFDFFLPVAGMPSHSSHLLSKEVGKKEHVVSMRRYYRREKGVIYPYTDAKKGVDHQHPVMVVRGSAGALEVSLVFYCQGQEVTVCSTSRGEQWQGFRGPSAGNSAMCSGDEYVISIDNAALARVQQQHPPVTLAFIACVLAVTLLTVPQYGGGHHHHHYGMRH